MKNKILFILTIIFCSCYYPYPIDQNNLTNNAVIIMANPKPIDYYQQRYRCQLDRENYLLIDGWYSYRHPHYFYYYYPPRRYYDSYEIYLYDNRMMKYKNYSLYIKRMKQHHKRQLLDQPNKKIGKNN